ncbi:MAG: TolC family protein [Gemmatimonadaceae bacterium]|nr:TolC family protein [Gemmatimonadaceae bacterium]
MRLTLLLAIQLVAVPLLAQGPTRSDSVDRGLTLSEALTLATRFNPSLRQVANDIHGANAAVRAAYGAFLPSADAALSSEFQQSGRQIFSGASLGASSDAMQSSYRIGLNYRLSAATFINPSLQKANREGVEADITGVESVVRSNVTQQYLNVLAANARADLQDTLLIAAEAEVVLARAREIVGAGTELDVRRAEVARGEIQVQQLRERNQIDIEELRLFQEMGVEPRTDVVLTTTFAVESFDRPLEELLALAREQNPVLLATRQRERVAELGVRRQRGEYMPTLSMSTGLAGYTFEYTNPDFLVQQAQGQITGQQAACVEREQRFAAAGLPNQLAGCSSITFTPAQAAALRQQNNQFPFGFNSSPRSISATLSLPVFDGFARALRRQEAVAASDDARHAVRARELAVTTDVTAAYLTLQTALRTVALQERNAAMARDEMKLSRDRYRLGMAGFIDLTQARDAFERAESARITAIYDYHKAFAALESAVGRPLR